MIVTHTDGIVAWLQDLFAACGVCKAWRQLGVHQFFEQPWDACPYIVHPMQLFSLVRTPCVLLSCGPDIARVHIQHAKHTRLAAPWRKIYPAFHCGEHSPAARRIMTLRDCCAACAP